MKILHVVRQFYPSVGGIQRFVLDLCHHLINRGHACDVITFNKNLQTDERLSRYEVLNGMRIYRISFWGPARYKVAPSVIRYIHNYDVIHIHAIDFFVDYLLLTKCMHKKPIVVSTHGGFFHTKVLDAFKRAYFHTISRFLLSQADRVIASSQHDYNCFSTILKDNLIQIENGVDLQRFSGLRKNVETGNLIFIGRLHRNKRIDNLIETVHYVKKDFPQIHLLIIGTDNEGLKEKYELLAKQKEVSQNVKFLGTLSDEEIKNYLSKAQFFISASEYEGFGISAIEAMGSGTIPILNQIEPFERFVCHGKDGFLVNFSHPQIAAETILNALRLDPAQLHWMSVRTKKKVQNYSWFHVIKRFENIYQEVIHSNKITSIK